MNKIVLLLVMQGASFATLAATETVTPLPVNPVVLAAPAPVTQTIAVPEQKEQKRAAKGTKPKNASSAGKKTSAKPHKSVAKPHKKRH